MAKDTPEQRTVPIYDSSGSQIGTTTPERAAQFSSDGTWEELGWTSSNAPAAPPVAPPPVAPPPVAPPVFSNPEQTTGFHDDNSGFTYYEPSTQTNETVAAEANPVQQRNDLNLGNYQNIQGDFVYGAMPEQYYLDPTGQFMIEGVDPNAVDYSWVDDGGLTFGGGGTPVATPRVQEPYNPIEIIDETIVDDPFEPVDEVIVDEPSEEIYQPVIVDESYTPPAPTVPNDREDLPVPIGGPITPWLDASFADKGDTSWNWDAFAPKREGDGAWGGYDEDYQAFERYQPGMESPWGMPDVQGGNEAFYQQQFVNQLRDEQGYQSRERQAQQRRQEALRNPFEAAPTDWSWANNGEGLKDVTLGTAQQGTPEGEWGFNQAYDLGKGNTNSEIIAGLGNIWTEGENQAWTDWREGSPQWENSQYIGSFDNPTDYMAAFNQNNPGVEGSWTALRQKLANNLWAQGGTTGGPTGSTPVGYAAPI